MKIKGYGEVVGVEYFDDDGKKGFFIESEEKGTLLKAEEAIKDEKERTI